MNQPIVAVKLSIQSKLLTEQNKKDVIFGNSLKNILDEFLKTFVDLLQILPARKVNTSKII